MRTLQLSNLSRLVYFDQRKMCTFLSVPSSHCYCWAKNAEAWSPIRFLNRPAQPNPTSAVKYHKPPDAWTWICFLIVYFCTIVLFFFPLSLSFHCHGEFICNSCFMCSLHLCVCNAAVRLLLHCICAYDNKLTWLDWKKNRLKWTASQLIETISNWIQENI